MNTNHDLQTNMEQLVQVLKMTITPKENHSSLFKDKKYIS